MSKQKHTQATSKTATSPAIIDTATEAKSTGAGHFPAAVPPAVNTAKKQRRGRPFSSGVSGNPAGRPRGSRNQATIIAESLIDGQAEKLVQKLIDRAFGNDMAALRLCIERLVPPRRDRPIAFELPEMTEAADAVVAMKAISTALAHGELTAAEAAELGRLVETFVRALEANKLTRQLALTKSVGKEVAGDGIFVNCITPAAAETAMAKLITPERRAEILGRIPMGRFVEVEEIARMVAWLISDDCSFSTGATFDISGGRASY